MRGRGTGHSYRPGSWTWEIVAVVFSLAALFALIGLLAYAEGKAILVWHGITLNTLISLLATASKLSALYALGSAIAQTKWNMFYVEQRYLLDFEAVNLASQGAFGSLQLLYRTRKIAVVGALAFLIALAFDPFAQQLIQYRGEVVFENNINATLPMAQRYSRGQRSILNMERTADNLPRVAATADFPLQAAIWNGLSQSQSSIAQQLPLTCPSGNCTWPPFDSLAVCSRCEDVRHMVEQHQIRNGTPLAVSTSGDLPTMIDPNMTRYTLPNGLYTDFSVGLTTAISESPSKTLTFAAEDDLLWSITMLKLTVSENSTTAYQLPLQAEECGLYYCVRIFESNMTNNRLLESSSERLDARRSPDSWRMQGLPEWWDDPDVNNFSEPEDLAFTDSSAIPMSDLAIGGRYNISQTAINSVGSFLHDIFVDTTYADPTHGLKGVDGICGNLSYVDCRPVAIKALWVSANMTELFDALALSMTNAIRVAGDNGTVQQGQNGILITKYRVEWVWIALPAAVLIASMVQLIITIIGSKGKPLWKNSTLAVMSRGRFVSDVLDELRTTREMELAASQRKVDLFELKQHEKHSSIDTASSLEDGSAIGSISHRHGPVSPLLNWRPGESVPAIR